MTTPTYEELQAENERLLTANDTLARHVLSTSARLEEGKRELLAIGWDAAVAAMVYEDGTPVECVSTNPYRPQAETNPNCFDNWTGCDLPTAHTHEGLNQ